jgi:hypothetical protein
MHRPDTGRQGSGPVTKESWPRKLHRLADRLDGRLRPTLRRAPRLEAAWVAVLDAIVSRQPDRAYLRSAILPALAQRRPERLLFVGVRRYTRSYQRSFRPSETEFWTVDIDPAAAQFGAPGRHVTADVRRIDEVLPGGYFSVVVMNVVFGWGVDDRRDMERALAATERVLAPGGLLLIGWNSDRCHRKSFDDVTHVYAWFRVRRGRLPAAE